MRFLASSDIGFRVVTGMALLAGSGCPDQESRLMLEQGISMGTCRFPCPPSQGAVAMPAALSIKENHSGRRTAWQLDAVPLPSVGMLPLCIFLDCA
jgi:hypothetical protein